MNRYAIYHATTGEIRQIIGTNDTAEVTANTPGGYAAMVVTEGVSGATHKISMPAPSEVVSKASMDTVCTLTNSGGVWNANGVDTISYGSALPNPTYYEIYCSNPEIEYADGTVTDGTFSLVTNAVGDYRIILRAFPYLDKTIEISAV